MAVLLDAACFPVQGLAWPFLVEEDSLAPVVGIYEAH